MIGNIILAHLVGDYLLQSHWMATTKTSSSVATLAHAIAYSTPFLLLTQAPAALAFILVTHFCIDRWRLARYVIFAKNFISPPSSWPKWERCKGTGYDESTPPWLAVWLLIIADNTLHLCCNAAALLWLT